MEYSKECEQGTCDFYPPVAKPMPVFLQVEANNAAWADPNWSVHGVPVAGKIYGMQCTSVTESGDRIVANFALVELPDDRKLHP